MWLGRSLAANPNYDNTFRLWAVALANAGRDDEAREKVREFLKLRPNATLDDWKVPNARIPPEVAKLRQHVHATLKRLGVPEGKVKAAATP